MVSPMILVNTIYTVIDSFTASGNSIMAFIDNVAGQAKQEVVAAAMYWMYFLLVIVIIMIVIAVLSAYIFYQKRD
jgi:ABC-type phosphate transport system permease subunit